MEFKLELFEEGEASVRSLEAIAAGLLPRIESVELAKSNKDTKWPGWLKEDVKALKSWGILQAIDGYNTKDGGREEFQKRSKEFFYEKELQQMLTIAVNSALLVYRPGAPGYDHGNTILFEAIADRPESMFHGVVTPEFKKRLVNGMFWEQLPKLTPQLNGGNGYPIVERALTEFFQDLELTFVPRGIEIFNRNAGYVKAFYLYGDENIRLSDGAISNYAAFIKQIGSKLFGSKIAREQFLPLVKAYVTVLEEINEDEDRVVPDWKKLIKEPIVKKYAPIQQNADL